MRFELRVREMFGASGILPSVPLGRLAEALDPVTLAYLAEWVLLREQAEVARAM